MGSAIAEVLPAAVSVLLINPIPIMAVILMLISPDAAKTAPAFVVGWVGGMVIVFGVLLFLVDPEATVGSESEPSLASSLLRLLLGLGLLFLAMRQWRQRPKAGEVVTPPSALQTLEKATPVTALGFGVVLSGLNPKNLAFTVATVVAIAQAELSVGEKIVSVAIYVVVASLGVVAPVVWYVLDRERASATLAVWRDWLMTNYALVMTVVLLLFGIKLAAQGLGGLIGG